MSVSSASPPIALPLRLGTAAASVPVVLLGIWLAGGVITDDFRASMALTAGWFALVIVGAVLVWRRLPAWRAVPLVAVGTFLVVGGYLGLTSVRDVRVDESVATGPALLAGRF